MAGRIVLVETFAGPELDVSPNLADGDEVLGKFTNPVSSVLVRSCRELPRTRAFTATTGFVALGAGCCGATEFLEFRMFLARGCVTPPLSTRSCPMTALTQAARSRIVLRASKAGYVSRYR
jgi:hypothetical protein